MRPAAGGVWLKEEVAERGLAGGYGESSGVSGGRWLGVPAGGKCQEGRGVSGGSRPGVSGGTRGVGRKESEARELLGA